MRVSAKSGLAAAGSDAQLRNSYCEAALVCATSIAELDEATAVSWQAGRESAVAR